MQMKRVLLAVILWSLVSLAGLAKADSIPIGQLSYLGTTPDGSSIFKVSLSPPAGISLSSLLPSIYIGDDKFTFALPTSGDLLFITGPESMMTAGNGTTASSTGSMGTRMVVHGHGAAARKPAGATVATSRTSKEVRLPRIPLSRTQPQLPQPVFLPR